MRALTHERLGRAAAAEESGTHSLVIPSQLTILTNGSPSKPRGAPLPLFTVISGGLYVGVFCAVCTLSKITRLSFPSRCYCYPYFHTYRWKRSQVQRACFSRHLVHLVLTQEKEPFAQVAGSCVHLSGLPFLSGTTPTTPSLCSSKRDPGTSNLCPPGSLLEM